MAEDLLVEEFIDFETHLWNIIQVHELPAEKLKIREVVPIDIANDPIAPADYKEKEDPTK